MTITSGCVNFQDCQTMPEDSAEDQENIPYVAAAQQIYEQRLQFKRKVVLKPADQAQLFLSKNILPNFSVQQKRELMSLFETVLTQEVGKLRDFEIVNTEAANLDVGGATISSGDEDLPEKPYLITFRIVDISFSNSSEGVVNIIGTVSDISGKSTRKETSTIRSNPIWKANAAVEVALTAPDGKRIFTFNRTVSTASLPMPQPDMTFLKDAVTAAAQRVCVSYARRFGPPLYVTQTIGNGQFVRLSAGTEYGISAGRKIKFYRNREHTLPALPGQTPKVEIQQLPVGEGTVGKYGAPVEEGAAWAYVENYDPEKRTVFLWTSARIAE